MRLFNVVERWSCNCRFGRRRGTVDVCVFDWLADECADILRNRQSLFINLFGNAF
jgi:hypothetical protein